VKRAELNARWASIYADRARVFLDVLGEREIAACDIREEIRARGTWWTHEQFKKTLNTLLDEGKIVRTGWARTARYRKP
jgi:uncharacterized protein YcaQ